MANILTIDEGTTGVTCGIFDTKKLKWVVQASEDFAQYFPKSGWVEHKPDEIWKAILRTFKRINSRFPLKNADAIGITNQRETVAFWDSEDSIDKVLCPAIVWQDRRTAEYCNSLRQVGHEALVNEVTGLTLDPYFSASKIRWAIHHQRSVKKSLDQGTLRVGTMDTYLIHRLTGGKSHKTEPSNASRTMLFNLHTLQWDQSLLDLFKIQKNILPEVVSSFGEFGKTHKVPFLKDGTPILGVLGDQQSAMLGLGASVPGSAKCTYGTGGFLLLNLGSKPQLSKNRLLTTVAWSHRGKPTYALEGSTFIAGAAVQWMRDQMGFIKQSKDIEKLALKVKSSEGVILIPSFTGIGAPYWNAQARGAIFGLSRGSTPAHLARATLEGIAHQIADVFEAMLSDFPQGLSSLRVDGGAALNNLLMQTQADFLKIPIERSVDLEGTSRGAALAAAIGLGLYPSPEKAQMGWKSAKAYKPKSDRSEDREEWKKYIQLLCKA